MRKLILKKGSSEKDIDYDFEDIFDYLQYIQEQVYKKHYDKELKKDLVIEYSICIKKSVKKRKRR